jgi:hypothetical protein
MDTVLQKKWHNRSLAKRLVILVLTVGFASFIPRPASAASTPFTMGVGVAFAPIGGHGFSFRKVPQSGFGFQCGTIFWKNNSDSYFNLGGEVLYVLRHTRLTAFYIPVGVSATYESQLQYRYDPPYTGMGQEYRETTTHFAGGAGLGFTVRSSAWEDIWFSMDLVMVADRDDVMPLPQFAIHYFFK